MMINETRCDICRCRAERSTAYDFSMPAGWWRIEVYEAKLGPDTRRIVDACQECAKRMVASFPVMAGGGD